ncbi:MAG: hypothetical protein NC253_11125 [Ruminococcus sp.]|nr:hypothetical protein [Ruminococcus sp.]MCM1380301.1 hypothetical protein [Muribaculaceae bacterium]MCM1478281.1 hypothetical protein [Muribaculaceae bacterium]
MIENSKIFAAVQIALEFREKLMELCGEYCDRVQEVCPEDIISKNRTYKETVNRLTYLQFCAASDISEKELEQAGYAIDFHSDDTDTTYYAKNFDGVEVVYSVDDKKEVQKDEE